MWEKMRGEKSKSKQTERDRIFKIAATVSHPGNSSLHFNAVCDQFAQRVHTAVAVDACKGGEGWSRFEEFDAI